VLREGFMANTSVGRFWRLALRNMAGFLPHKNDKATFGNTFRVVLAENEDALAKIGWPPNSVDMGFSTGDNTVTISRMTGGGVMPSVTGSTPQQMLPYLADGVAKQTGWEMVFTVGGLSFGTLRPVLILSPILAETIARAGWSKQDVKRYLYEHARTPAWRVEAFTEKWLDFRTAWCRSCSTRRTSWCSSPETPCGPTLTPSPRTAIWASRLQRRSCFRRTGRNGCKGQAGNEMAEADGNRTHRPLFAGRWF
jgi:hypothetical protein